MLTYAVYKSLTSDRKTHRLKVKGWKKIFHENGNKQTNKKDGIAILIPVKMNFKTKLYNKRRTQQFHFCVFSQRNPKTLNEKDIYIYMFITALFIITKIWKQTKFPLTDKWIKRKWYICVQWNMTQS